MKLSLLSKNITSIFFAFNGNLFSKKLEKIFKLKLSNNLFPSILTNNFFPIISEALHKNGNNNNGYAISLNEHFLYFSSILI